MEHGGRLLLIACLVGSGCTGDDPGPPVDAAGAYLISTRNGANECTFAGWTEGATAAGVPFTITQTGSSVTADVGGAAATYMDIVFGTHTFTGGVTGNTLHLTLTGMRAGSMAACAYTVDGTATATLVGDALDGVIYYEPQTNGSPDCGVLNTCRNRQDFNGTRPP